jgi:hypothetical protein
MWLKSAMTIWHNPVTKINGQDTANVIWALLTYMSSIFILLFWHTLINPLFVSLYNNTMIWYILSPCWRSQDESEISKTATTSVNPSACIHSSQQNFYLAWRDVLSTASASWRSHVNIFQTTTDTREYMKDEAIDLITNKSRQLIWYNDKDTGWAMKESGFNSQHGKRFVSSPACPD